MSRRTIAQSPAPVRGGAPLPAKAPAPRQGRTQTRGDNSVATYSGSLSDLSPIQDDGGEVPGVPQISENLHFGAGGEPVRSVVDESSPDDEARPVRYRVLEDKQVATNGHRYTLRAGKEIDASNYNIAALRKFGVKLEEIGAGG